MNLDPSDSERRLQMQQADTGPTPGKRAPNPFAAAFGIGGLVSLIWLFFALGRAFQELLVLLHKGVNLTHFPF